LYTLPKGLRNLNRMKTIRQIILVLVAAIFLSSHPAQARRVRIDNEDIIAQTISELIGRLEQAKQSGQNDTELQIREQLSELLTMASYITTQTYNRILESYVALRGEVPEGKDLEMLQRFLGLARAAESTNPAKILDIGTGLRDFAWFARQENISITGIDIAESVVDLIRKNATDSESISVMDMQELGFNDEAFAGVRCWATLHHLPLVDSKQGADVAVTEAYRVLKSGGVYCVFVKAETEERKGFMPIDTEEGFGKRFYQFYSKESLKLLLERNGFVLLDGIEEWTDSRGEKNLIVFAQKP
jgi:ubiquinone/menaquinone biosynthesis C-methylase UbiE